MLTVVSTWLPTAAHPASPLAAAMTRSPMAATPSGNLLPVSKVATGSPLAPNVPWRISTPTRDLREGSVLSIDNHLRIMALCSRKFGKVPVIAQHAACLQDGRHNQRVRMKRCLLLERLGHASCSRGSFKTKQCSEVALTKNRSWQKLPRKRLHDTSPISATPTSDRRTAALRRGTGRETNETQANDQSG